jgi:hypothetical protein
MAIGVGARFLRENGADGVCDKQLGLAGGRIVPARRSAFSRSDQCRCYLFTTANEPVLPISCQVENWPFCMIQSMMLPLAF